MSNNQYGNDYGTAAPATERDLRRAKIIGSKRRPIFGYFNRLPCYQPSDGSIAVWGGAGSGKSASIFMANELSDTGMNTITFDPRGEITACGMLQSSLLHYHTWVVNPFGISGLPQHNTNPLDHLTPDNPTLISDARKTISDLLPSTGGAKWWQDSAHEIVLACTLFLIEHEKNVSLKTLYRALCDIAETDTWASLSEAMQNSQHAEVRGAADTLIMAKLDGREAYTAPMNTIKTTFAWAQETKILDAVSGSDFSLSVVTDTTIKARVKIIFPAQHLGLTKGLVRLLLGRPIQDKFKMGGSHRIGVIVDECGQLSHFPSIMDLYTYGRGAGVFGLCSWQAIGQTIDAFGKEGADAIMSSAQIRVFAGVRDIDTARIVSAMGGTLTRHYFDEKKQADAQRGKEAAVIGMVQSGDILKGAQQARHFNRLKTIQDQQSRWLLTPDEVLNYSGMVAFASGIVEGAILGEWVRFYERKQWAGRYLCNPYHDPEFVTLKTWYGRTKKARMLTADCPPALAHMPQYQASNFQFIQGYRPRL